MPAMSSASNELALTAARIVVEEGMEYGPAKRRAAKQLGLTGRGDLPDNDQVEAAVVEYAFEVEGEPPRETSWERQCTGRLRQLHVEIQFAGPDRLPLVAEVFTRVGDRVTIEPIGIVDHRLSCLTQDFGPGVYGVRWRW